MSCDDVMAALAEFNLCLETPDGSRVTTHCVYPSFDPVNVFISRFGDGYQVHDGCGAARSAAIHARDEVVIARSLKRWAGRFHLSLKDDLSLQCVVHEASWLTSAILAVANASAGAANEAIEHVAVATETALKTRMYEVLSVVTPKDKLHRDYEFRGASGKLHAFDFAIDKQGAVTLLDAVAPHHVSVSAKYVAFADAGGHSGPEKYAVYDRELDVGDTALLQQVADLVPFASLRGLFPGGVHVQ